MALRRTWLSVSAPLLGTKLQAFSTIFGFIDNSVGGWVPANLPIFSNSQNHPRLSGAHRPAGSGGCYPPTTAPSRRVHSGSRWGSSSWTEQLPATFTCLAARESTAMGSKGCSMTYGSALPALRLMPPALAPALAHGAFVGGSTTGNTSGTYGTQGTPGGVPGGRWAAATTTDASGNFWLFGGQGLDSAGTTGLLNDLWEYNASANQWTWIGPSTSNVANQNGNYGTLGTGSGTTAPGGRQAAVLWADTSGNIWLFGGFGLDSAGTGNAGPPPAGAILNDLWEYNITTKQWIWVSGNNLANQTGNYGTEATSNLSTGAATNIPGSRWGAVGWSDANSNLWFFGGWGYGTSYHGPDWIPGRHLGVSAQLRAVDLVEGNQQCQPEQRVCDHIHTFCQRRALCK